MHINRKGSLPILKGPEAGFTGQVTISDYFERPSPSRVIGATVNFAPGSRTPWKASPLGQTLIVTSGFGWTRREGDSIVEIRAGDIVWYPPGQRHWDGAAPDQGMTCIVIHEAQDGRAVEFMERVTDEDYLEGPPAVRIEAVSCPFVRA